MISKIKRVAKEILTYYFLVNRSAKNIGLLKSNQRIKNSETGEVFILLTGASLKNKDLSFLQTKKIIATNLFFMSDYYSELDIDHYLVVEPWDYRKQWFLSWILEMVMLRKKPGSKPHIWLHSTSFPYVGEGLMHFDRDTNLLLKKAQISFIGSNGDFASGEIQAEFNNIVNTTSGSIYASIFFAIYCGYKKIYLLGADYTKQPMRIGHFYDNVNEIWSRQRVDELSQKDSLMDKMEKKLLKTKNYAKAHNVEIINVLDSDEVSSIFKGVNFKDLLF